MRHCVLVGAACAALLAGCRLPPAPPDNPATAETSTRETAAFLDMDFTAGGRNADVRPVELAQGIRTSGLSDALAGATGIPFSFTLTWQGETCTVAWQQDSALWTQQMPQGQEPDYLFYDADLLRWFLLDTVWQTLQQEFGAEEVYYCDADGQPLQLADLWPLEHFDLSQPYRGSGWYYSESIAYLDNWKGADRDAQP